MHTDIPSQSQHDTNETIKSIQIYTGTRPICSIGLSAQAPHCPDGSGREGREVAPTGECPGRPCLTDRLERGGVGGAWCLNSRCRQGSVIGRCPGPGCDSGWLRWRGGGGHQIEVVSDVEVRVQVGSSVWTFSPMGWVRGRQAPGAQGSSGGCLPATGRHSEEAAGGVKVSM